MRGLVERAVTVRAAALALCAGLALGAAPAHAEEGGLLGFLSSAFGGGREPAPAASPTPAPSEGEQVRPLTVRRAPRKAAHAGGRARLARAPGKTGPVSIYEDPTLRTGDAVMTKDGMKVFAGGRLTPDHPYSDGDFVTVSTAKAVSPEMKKTVTELNKLPHG